MTDSASTDITDASPPAGVPALLDELDAIIDQLQTAGFTRLTDTEVDDAGIRIEQAIARLTYTGNQQIVEADQRDLPRKAGYRSVIDYMKYRLRMAYPGKRLKQTRATATYPDATTGAPLEPVHPTLAKEFADGRVGSGHVHAVMDVLDQIPHAVDHDIKVAAERTMAEQAVNLTPDQITDAGARLLGYLDPDGTLTDDTDRQRRRNLYLNRQRADGTAKMAGTLTPELLARVSMFLAVWAKPGMNNPNDPESPTGSIEDADPDAVAAAAERDDRSPAQLNHDALNALLKAVFEDGMLGKSHRGLPMQVIVKADLNDLVREAGYAVTATGTQIPVTDLIPMIADAQPWLAVFKDATAVPLYFGRGKRLATREQRLVSFARPDGESCSNPDCCVPATHVEMHHAHIDWVDGGFTDITNLTPACTRHHHMVGNQPGQFTTRIVRDGPDEGRTTWQLNTAPGAPPNPERVNRRPDIPRRFADHLKQVRDEIHGPEPESGDQPRLYLRQVIDLRDATPVELVVASALLDHAYGRSGREGHRPFEVRR
ncbi:HNH endonuclease [Gordonia alkanivorans]|uniref:HNH endonuclease signature motif containing protein n=1 Tax=Gordonia alkanivorans TaxID=84096 RepID=UPI000FDD5BDE|nr:HNH endonuclease signature motif containing protein [Gordonia alkanivorans]AZZ83535.1 HNH endonuclease [Gordonia alkanivorans]